MRLEFGSPVYSCDGQVVGTINRLILDSETEHVKAIALRQGHLLPHDVEVPITALEAGAGGQPRLLVPANQARQFPPFIESNYREATPQEVRLSSDPSPEVLLPASYLYVSVTQGEATPHSRQVAENLAIMFTQHDVEHAIVREGSAVRSSDGQRIGDLHELIFDDETGRLSHVVIRHGVVPRGTLTLPASLVAAVGDGVIELTAPVAWARTWARLEPGIEVWTNDRTCLGAIESREVDHLLVAATESGHRVRVPLSAVGRLSQNRLILREDQARAVLWEHTPE
jgi:sporulation protein YlmC with PRC-barrel domain